MLAPRDFWVKLFAAIKGYVEAKKAAAKSDPTIELDRHRLNRCRVLSSARPGCVATARSFRSSWGFFPHMSCRMHVPRANLAAL